MKVRIFSKEAGSNPDVWGVEIQGRRGYVNKIHIKEEQTIIGNAKLIKVPTELLTTQGIETPVTEKATASPLASANVEAAVPVVTDFSTKIQGGDAVSSSAPAEQVASSPNPVVKVAQLAEDATKTTSEPSEALNSNSETKSDATPVVNDIPVNEPLVIKKEAYVTTATEKNVPNRQDNVNETEEVQLEVIAPFADKSKPDQVAQPVPQTLKPTITADPSKITPDEKPQNSIVSEVPLPNTSIVNEKLEPTLEKSLPSSNVVPNIVTDSPPKATETANLTTAAPVLASTTKQVLPAKIAPQAAVTTTNAPGTVISAAVSTGTDTTAPSTTTSLPVDSTRPADISSAADSTVPLTTTSPPMDSTRPADIPAVTDTTVPFTTTSSPMEATRPADIPVVPPTLTPKTDDPAIINNGTTTTDIKGEPLPQINHKTDHLNSSEDTTTNIPSSPSVNSKMLHIDDPITDAKILLQDDDLNITDTSSEDFNSLMEDSVEDYENTTDSIETRDSNETIVSSDEDTKATPSPFIDPYESLKNQDYGYPVTDLPASNEVATPSSTSAHHHHHEHHHDHKYPAGGQVPSFYPTKKPYVPHYPSSGNSAEVPVETAQSASDTSSEVVNESMQVPNEVKTPISVNSIEKVTSDFIAVPEGVGSVEQVLPPLLEVPPVADLITDDNVITEKETETIDDGPGMFSNLWNSITSLFDTSEAPADSQLQQDANDFQQKVNDMLFTTPEEAAAAKPAIVGE